jgi:hypothetical protein
MATDGYSCALRLLVALPSSVQTLVSALPAELIGWQPAPDQWSIRDVLAHLLAAETAVTRPRIEQMLREEHALLAVAPLIAPLGGAEHLLAASVPFYRALTAEQLARTARHPHHGAFAVRDLVIVLAYDDQDHRQQIVTIVQAALYPHMQRFYAQYPRPT